MIESNANATGGEPYPAPQVTDYFDVCGEHIQQQVFQAKALTLSGSGILAVVQRDALHVFSAVNGMYKAIQVAATCAAAHPTEAKIALAFQDRNTMVASEYQVQTLELEGGQYLFQRTVPEPVQYLHWLSSDLLLIITNSHIVVYQIWQNQPILFYRRPDYLCDTIFSGFKYDARSNSMALVAHTKDRDKHTVSRVLVFPQMRVDALIALSGNSVYLNRLPEVWLTQGPDASGTHLLQRALLGPQGATYDQKVVIPVPELDRPMEVLFKPGTYEIWIVTTGGSLIRVLDPNSEPFCFPLSLGASVLHAARTFDKKNLLLLTDRGQLKMLSFELVPRSPETSRPAHGDQSKPDSGAEVGAAAELVEQQDVPDTNSDRDANLPSFGYHNQEEQKNGEIAEALKPVSTGIVIQTESKDDGVQPLAAEVTKQDNAPQQPQEYEGAQAPAELMMINTEPQNDKQKVPSDDQNASNMTFQAPGSGQEGHEMQVHDNQLLYDNTQAIRYPTGMGDQQINDLQPAGGLGAPSENTTGANPGLISGTLRTVHEMLSSGQQAVAANLGYTMPAWSPQGDATTQQSTSDPLQPKVDTFDDVSDEAKEEAKKFVKMMQDDGSTEMLEDLEIEIEQHGQRTKAYFQILVKKEFGSTGLEPEEQHTIKPEHKLAFAIAQMEEARKSRGDSVKIEEYRIIQEYASAHGEDGKGVKNEELAYYLDKDTKQIRTDPFDVVVRSHVFKLLRFQGSFERMVITDYFVSERQGNEFFFQASPKVPFQFLRQCYPHIAEAMLADYQRNPFNPTLFVKYDQSQANLHELAPDDAAVRRTIHLDDLYERMQDGLPSLLCLGSPGIGKSSLLNQMLGCTFEELSPFAAGLFHDSVDALLHSEEFQCGFNLFDFHRYANQDYILIEALLRALPSAMLFIQLKSMDFLDQVLVKIDQELLARVTPRILVVNRTDKKTRFVHMQIEKKVRGFNVQQVYDFKTKGEKLPENELQNLLKWLYNTRKQLMHTLEREATQLQGQQTSQGKFECTGVHRDFWLIRDSLECYKGEAFVLASSKTDGVRESHREIKRLLFGGEVQEASLVRDCVFPEYMRRMKLNQLAGKLKKARTDQQVGEVKRAEQALVNQQLTASPVLELFLKLLFWKRTYAVQDFWKVVESFYMPRKNKIRQKINEERKGYPVLEQKLRSFQDPQGNLKPGTQVQEDHRQTQAEIKELKQRIQDLTQQEERLVLDSDLFLREAKILCEREGGEKQQALYALLTSNFEGGKSMEIIDGDLDTMEKTSFDAVMDWVLEKKRNNTQLLVITILGPQSSGKSTLLNFLFGSKFHVSAGRCTKGLNAMLLRTDCEDVRELLILDSEGLFGIERDDARHDRQLVILCMAISNLLLINIKGEISSTITQVMQVAIYAIQKIVETQCLKRTPKILFILRDQMDLNPAAIDTQYQMLRNKFMEAARAASRELESIVDIPYAYSHDQRILFMFPSALLNDQNSMLKRPYQIVQSSGNFRDRCSELRAHLFSLAKNISFRDRINNLKQWGQDVHSVWTAVQQNDELTLIRDLQQINNHKQLIEKLVKFRSIMTMPAPAASEPAYEESVSNPLLDTCDVEEFQHMRLIQRKDTIFAQLRAKIDEAITNIRLAQNKKDLEMKIEAGFRTFKETQVEIYRTQVQELTREMGEVLQNIGDLTIMRTIDHIYSKALEYWRSQKLQEEMNFDIQALSDEVKAHFLEMKNRGQSMDRATFMNTLQEKKKELLDNIVNSMKQEGYDPFNEAKAAFDQLVDQINYDVGLEPCRGDVTEEVKEDQAKLPKPGLKSKIQILQKSSPAVTRQIQPTVFEYSELWLGQQAHALHNPLKFVDHFATVNYTLLHDLADARLKKNDKNYQALEMNMQELRKNGDTHHEIDFNRQQVAVLLDKQVQEFVPYIQAKIENDFEVLCNKIIVCLCAVRDRLLCMKSQQQLEVNRITQVITQLVGLFEEELTRQNEERFEAESLARVDVQVTYQQQYYMSQFNALIFNILMRFVEHKQTTLSQNIENQIDAQIQTVQQFYDRMSCRLSSVEDQVRGFHEMLIEAIFSALRVFKRKSLQNQFLSTDAIIDKKLVQERIFKRFLDAQDDPQGRNYVLRFITDRIQLETETIEEIYDELGNKKKDSLLTEFYDEVEPVINTLRKIYEEICYILSHVEPTHWESLAPQDLQRFNTGLFNFIYATVMQSLVKDSDTLKIMLAERDVCQTMLPAGVELPRDPLQVLVRTAELSEQELPSLSTDQDLIKKFANEVREIATFFQLAPNFNEAKTRIQVQNLKQAFKEEMEESIAAKPNLQTCLNAAIGCGESCRFCGARCSETIRCADNEQPHKTDFHQPMAFKGSFTRDQKSGKKLLLHDYCTSETNMKSAWPVSNSQRSEVDNIMQRLNSHELYTQGMNLYLEWTNGSDLDIQVRCACNKWHGYGTKGGSEGKCFCDKCHMRRDHDMRETKEPRKVSPAFEHVWFSRPDLLYNQDIQFRVYCYENGTAQPSNEFKVAIFNRYGYQLYPNPGAQEIERREWMSLPKQDKAISQVQTYRFLPEHDQLMDRSHYRSFQEHAYEHARGWAFTEQMDAHQLNKFREFITACRSKWHMVKQTLCGPDHFGCELLDDLDIYLDTDVNMEEQKQQ